MEKANIGNDETGYKYRIELAGHGSEHIASRDDGSRYSDADSLKKKETLPPVSKAEIIKELPVIVRCIAKVLCLFEKDSHPIKRLQKCLAITTIIVSGISALLGLQFSSDGSVTSNIRLSNISTSICFCIYGPMSIISIQKYFYDSAGRARFLDSWRSMSFSARQKARSYTSRSFWGWFVYFLVSVVNLMIIFLVWPEEWAEAPLVKYIYSGLTAFCGLYSFSFGFILYFTLLIFRVVVETESITVEISKMSKKAETSISKFTSEICTNYDEKSKPLLNPGAAKKFIKELTDLYERIAAKVNRPVTLIGNTLGVIIVSLIFLMLFLLVDEVLDTMAGRSAENRAQIYFLVLLEVLWMGGLYVFLTLSIKPSVHYGYFVERLHRGDSLLCLSECFSGDQLTLKYFFEGLELQRKYLVWRVFGIPVTFRIFNQIFGSMLSLLVASLAFALRQSG